MRYNAVVRKACFNTEKSKRNSVNVLNGVRREISTTCLCSSGSENTTRSLRKICVPSFGGDRPISENWTHRVASLATTHWDACTARVNERTNWLSFQSETNVWERRYSDLVWRRFWRQCGKEKEINERKTTGLLADALKLFVLSESIVWTVKTYFSEYSDTSKFHLDENLEKFEI